MSCSLVIICIVVVEVIRDCVNRNLKVRINWFNDQNLDGGRVQKVQVVGAKTV